jgi:hypothetical protein
LVIVDTGEGRYIDGVLDRLMTADLAAQPPVIVPCPSFSPIKALIVAATVWAGVGVIWLPMIGPSRMRGMAIGLVVCACFGLTSAAHGLMEIRAKPDELYGAGRAKLAIALLMLAMVMAVVSLNVRLKRLPTDAGTETAVPTTLPAVENP